MRGTAARRDRCSHRHQLGVDAQPVEVGLDLVEVDRVHEEHDLGADVDEALGRHDLDAGPGDELALHEGVDVDHRRDGVADLQGVDVGDALRPTAPHHRAAAGRMDVAQLAAPGVEPRGQVGGEAVDRGGEPGDVVLDGSGSPGAGTVDGRASIV